MMALRNAVVLLVGFSLASPWLQDVQAQSAVTASIPFEFRVRDSQMPAGSYRLFYLSPNVLAVQSSTTDKAAVVVITGERSDNLNISYLTFKRYGRDAFLSEVHLAGREIGAKLHPSPAERELARKYGPVPVMVASQK